MMLELCDAFGRQSPVMQEAINKDEQINKNVCLYYTVCLQLYKTWKEQHKENIHAYIKPLK